MKILILVATLALGCAARTESTHACATPAATIPCADQNFYTFAAGDDAGV